MPPEPEVGRICQDLLRIDTSNFGDDSGPGERLAAEYCAGLLAEVGCEVVVFESRPRRTSVVTRIPGADSNRPALVLHGHTDVVPAQASEWRVPPFSGAEIDGVLWGRGAVDMKGMDAIILAVVRDLLRTGRRPARDLIVAFFADEEAGGVLGAQWAVTNRPELFDGASEAISEVGGFSVTLTPPDGSGPRRAYLLQTAEKSIGWYRLLARGRAGHGSVINRDNAVTQLGAAVGRIGAHQWPINLVPTTRAMLAALAQVTGIPTGPTQLPSLLAACGTARPLLEATVAHTANPTGLQAGYKVNVIPAQAEAMVDCRWLPGAEAAGFKELQRLAGPDIEILPIHEDPGFEAPRTGPLIEAMAAALHAQDPGAPLVPFVLSGGTDNKSLARLGIVGYGFSPLRLPPELDFVGLFHGVDERVPITALQFGCRVLEQLLLTC